MPPLIRKIEPGDVIGRCRIIRELGRGGVGTVYLAVHQTLQIEVALKILSPSLSLDNPALAERFVREAQLAARIRHPNVIAVMDAAQDETSGLYYIVMEYVGGGSLSWHLRHGSLPEAKALDIMIGIAHALVIAEEKRIVHRDIKPDNIMLDLRGTPKLADLGLAKHAIDSHTSITLGGSFMGTPAYMSPEQARDAKIADTRDDIYSLGATFYECLTGVAPFQGETPYNIMSELLTKPSPCPGALRPDLSRSSDLICRKMMSKTRDLRYANAHSLLRDLQICRTVGDNGLDQLEAARLERDALRVREQALDYGVETSSDGVALVQEPEENARVGGRPVSELTKPSRADYNVFGAAALLVAMVTVATLLLAWGWPNSFLKKEYVLITSAPTVAPSVTPPPVVPPPVVPHKPPHVVTTSGGNPVVHRPPVNPGQTAETGTQVESGPVVLVLVPPVLLPMADLGIAPASVLDPNIATIAPAIPAEPVQSESAFAARVVAEGALPTNLMGANQHVPLLKIVGHRDDPPDLTPATWTFYFYDKSAKGHAWIVSVKDHKVVDRSEDLFIVLSPFREQDIMPEDKLLTDSTQVLEIASSQIPGVTVSSSEFSLSQERNSVPMWKVTLWSKKQNEDEHKLGDATIAAENGYVFHNTLRP